MKSFVISLLLIVTVVSCYEKNSYAQVSDISQEEMFVYDDKGKRDPLWPLVSPSGTILNYDSDFVFSELNLEGIITDPGGKNVAIINGRIVNINDRLGQYVVLEISPVSVTLRKGQEKFKLKIKR